MRIGDLYHEQANEQPVISFEFFPPKTDIGFRSLFRTIEDLKPLGPSFVSVTMGAGGSTRRKTVDLVTQIQRDIGITTMCHLPCVGFERSEVAEILDRLSAEGVSNVLALGGDPPGGEEDFTPPSDGFEHANELVEFIHGGWDFSIGAACFPETHPDAESPEADLRHLAHKVRCGSDFLVSQLFFDNRDYFSFVERARAQGIECPIVPGIMPITSGANIRRITALCGARIPQELDDGLRKTGEDDAATFALGLRWATEQCRELIGEGVPGIHFYTLNRSPATTQIYRELFGG